MPLPPPDRGVRPIQTIRWIRNPFQVMSEHQARYGDTFTIRLPAMPSPLVLVSDPEVVKEIFALGPDEGHAGKANAVLKPFLGQHSLLLLDGSEHLRQRKMMLPAFHGERMHAYGRTMMDLAHDSIDRWPVGSPFAVHRPMQSTTLQVIIRTVFGVGEGPRFAELADVLTRALDAGASPILLFPIMQRDLGRFSPWGRFLHYGERASQILRDEIRRGRREGATGRTDVLAMMLDARDEAGTPMSEDEIHDELVTLLTAGH
ncbi:MAG TPA: cytochrome P450, partial [Polyangiaceae bacterium]|nr:cytochrome P450 [Polyangiaceae bacterium]